MRYLFAEKWEPISERLCGCASQAHVRKVVPGTETINFREARPALHHRHRALCLQMQLTN